MNWHGWRRYHWAKEGPGHGAIVEIGSLMGRSTCWLACGTRAVGRKKVVAVDHFRGSPEHQANASHSVRVIVSEGSTLPIFLGNLDRNGLRDWVEVHVGSSVEIGAKWQGPIRFLFIDGDHSHESTRSDVALWAQHVVKGGIMAFHDVDIWPGVTAYYCELVGMKVVWKEISKVRSLRVLQRQI